MNLKLKIFYLMAVYDSIHSNTGDTFLRKQSPVNKSLIQTAKGLFYKFKESRESH
jgi:hypothetical protein